MTNPLPPRSGGAARMTELSPAARRSRPSSLAEEALEQLSSIRTAFKIAYGGDLVDTFIRRALERLQELENND